MLYAKPLIPVLIVLMLVHVGALRAVKAAVPERWVAWSRLGYGLAKLCLLLLPLEWLVQIFLHAEPAVVTGKSIWLAAMAQTAQIYLSISGMADVVLAVQWLRGRACMEACDAPYRQGSFIGVWQHLHRGLSTAKGPATSSCLPVMVLVGGVALLWHGSVRAVSVWFLIHFLLIWLESKRGKSLFAPLPMPLRVIFTMLLFILTQVLLLVPDLSMALQSWQQMFHETPPKVYALMLDKRLTSGWLQIILSLSLLVSIGLPRLPLVLTQPIKTWRLFGLLLIPVSALLLLRDSTSAPAFIRQAVQVPVTWLFDEGNAQVHLGYESWFFPMSELNRLTLRRPVEGATPALEKLAAELKAQNVAMLVVAAPAKIALYPDQFLRAEYPAPVHPPGHSARLERLKAAGIEVLDPAQALWDRLIRAQAFYQNDSHWTPDTMKEVVTMAAKLIRQKWPGLHQAETPLIKASILERQDRGDLLSRLLPQGDTAYGQETAQLVSIRGLESDPKSPVLILGSDLLTVFDDPAASFGNAEGEPQHAGFATQLASLMGRPLEVMTTAPTAVTLTNELKTKALTKKLVIIVIGANEL